MLRTGPQLTRLTQPPSLSEVAQRFIERAASTDDILQAYYRDPRVKRLITAASRQFRQSDDFIEELHQDLALLLVEKFIFELSDADKIGGLKSEVQHLVKQVR